MGAMESKSTRTKVGRPPAIEAPDADAWATVAEAAAAVGVSDRTIRRAMRAGKVRTRREGKNVYVHVGDCVTPDVDDETEHPAAALMRETRTHLSEVMTEYKSLATFVGNFASCVTDENKQLRAERERLEAERRRALDLCEMLADGYSDREMKRSILKDEHARAQGRKDVLATTLATVLRNALGLSAEDVEATAAAMAASVRAAAGVGPTVAKARENGASGQSGPGVTVDVEGTETGSG